MSDPQRKQGSDNGFPVQFAFRRIELREQSENVATELGPKFSLSPITCRILAARGYRADDELKSYLERDPRAAAKSGLPHPEKLKGLTEALQILEETLTAGHKVAIANDFDVDGLTGGVQIYRVLRSAGFSPRLFVPHRFQEGYGLNNRIVDEAAGAQCKLLITVDYGTTNTREIEYAQSKGMKVIVIDHHHVQTPPPADAFVNPYQAGCNFAGGLMCASALVWYFITRARSTIAALREINPWEYLPYAGIGTICDMVPLIGPNRVLAKGTLALLSQSKHPGLNALLQVSGASQKVTCTGISFGIGPRINAAGRMVDGMVVAKLLTTEDAKEAAQLAKDLDTLNAERQETEQEAKKAAIAKVFRRSYLNSGIIVADKNYHTGVVGLVAQRLVDSFYLPAAVFGFENGEFKGSIRGVKGFHVAEMIERLKPLLTKGGGHAAAGGMSFPEKNFKKVEQAFYDDCFRQLGEKKPQPVQLVDTEATLPEITPALVRELSLFEPFGMGNPAPTVLLEPLTVKSVKTLKDAHLKCELTDGNVSIEGLLWRRTSHPALSEGSTVRVAARPEINTFRGERAQLNLQAVESV